MMIAALALAFFSGFGLVMGISSLTASEKRATLQRIVDSRPKEEKKGFRPLQYLAFFNKPLCMGPLGERIEKGLILGRLHISPEEFLLIKELLIIILLFFTYPMSSADQRMVWLFSMIGVGWYLPEFWLKSKVQKSKNAIIRELPDAIDLLALCVNAGLDFLLALKWVVDKSAPSILIEELNHVMQEVNIGKPRRDALVDFANKYRIPDLSTFTRALVQADRMGTSVAEALNIISEDMRLSRFRRGEQTALKAPLKMLFPLLFCIFPVVGIMVAGPVMLQFMQGSPFKSLGAG